MKILLRISLTLTVLFSYTFTKSQIPERILAIQQGFNEKYDTENFLKELDDQLGNLNRIDERIKDFKQWVEKKSDNILYHMEHNNDMSTPNLLIKMLYAKKMIEVSRITKGQSKSSHGSEPIQVQTRKSGLLPRG
jgi:archaellum component FlaC